MRLPVFAADVVPGSKGEVMGPDAIGREPLDEREDDWLSGFREDIDGRDDGGGPPGAASFTVERPEPEEIDPTVAWWR
jgi:hypothetical protein